MSELNSGFVLKKMYENIVVDKSISKVPVNNANLTDDIAINLIAYTKKGYGYFKSLSTAIDLQGTINELGVNLNGTKYHMKDVGEAFVAENKKGVSSPTPYNYQLYFTKLSRASQIAIKEHLAGVIKL